MEGKLFKMVEGYTLSLTGSIDDLYGISDKQLAEDHQLHKLSLKNCQVIANGYDLDELFDEVDESIDYQEFDISSFKLGFKKAIEILGDKKFSEFLDREKELGISDIKTIERIQWYYKTYFDKSQQTEWDVEIEMVFKHIPKNNGIHNAHTMESVPKLDDNGCLILRRI